MSTETKIRDEIAGKADDFFSRQSAVLSEYEQWGDLFKVKAPTRKSNTFSNPRQTEFLRAATAVGTMTYRMMTAADPFFTISPVDTQVNYDQLDTVSHVLRTQLKFARYRENLLRACHFAPVFGTVICQEDYRVIGISSYGRKLPVTVLMPRSLDQVMFDRATLDIHDADWLGTADITSDAELMRLIQEVKEIDAPWNAKVLEAAAKEKETKNTINWQVLNRIQRAGFSTDDALNSKKKELLMYYGKLECMNDGIEYVAALINRKFLVRFHANNFQHGRRPFRVAKWIDFDGAMGLGYGHTLSRQHAAMDANRQKVQDLGAWGAYGMFKRRKTSTDNQNMVLGPLRIVDVENMDDLQPLSPDLRGAENLLNLDAILKQEFRSAALAGDTLQAIASDATATGASLAQDQNVRGLSVIAERNSNALVREHIENTHANNGQNVKAPFNINKAGVARRVYPSDLRMDLEVEAKTSTDKDFQPKRLEKLIQLTQILTSTKSDHPDQLAISILPIVKEIAYELQVNPNDVIMRPNAMPPMPTMGAGDMAGLAGLMAPGGIPGAGGGIHPMETPVGNTLVA